MCSVAYLRPFVEQLLSQRPHLEGKHIHQSVFSLWKDIPDSPRTACSYEGGQFSLHAGLIHGITTGSTFHIYSTDRVSDTDSPMASAVVTHVGSFASWLKLPPLDSFVKSNKHTWYAQLVTMKSGSSFATYCNDAKFLTRVLGDNSPPKLLLAAATVTNPDKADLCLMVEGKGDARTVSFDRGGRNPFLSAKSTGLPSRLPDVVSSIDDISKIRNIVNHYAHFTAHLDSTLTAPPITKFVCIEMKQLDSTNIAKLVGPNLLRDDDEPIQISVDVSSQQRPCYGFTIRNVSKVNLYVYMFYFDASTLEIGTFTLYILVINLHLGAMQMFGTPQRQARVTKMVNILRIVSTLASKRVKHLILVAEVLASTQFNLTFQRSKLSTFASSNFSSASEQ